MKTQFLFLFVLMACVAHGQVDSVEVVEREMTPLEAAEDQLKVMAKSVMTTFEQTPRLEAAELFVETFEQTLQMEGAFDYPFDSLTSVSMLYPSDSTFRIMTWQLYVDKDEYKYFGFIQHPGNPSKGVSPKLDRLDDFSGRMRSIERKELNPQNWYGALYYGIKSFKTKQGTYYALFGFDAYQFFEKRKIMEILSFDENRNATFGAPFIQYIIKQKDVPPRELTYYRFMLQYSSEASVSINFDEDEDMILFDHLIPMNANYPGVEYVMVPDGSYEGFKYKKNMWTYVEKVYDQVLESAPRPAPVFNAGKKKKDIFGRPR